MTKKRRKMKSPKAVVFAFGGVVLIPVALYGVISMENTKYVSERLTEASAVSQEASATSAVSSAETVSEPAEPVFVVTHVDTPQAVKAIYMTSWVAGTPSLRYGLVDLIDETEINAVVIDIKDATGKVAFEVEDPALHKIGSSERRVRDMKEFIGELHDKDIYVIGRVAVFQDPYLAVKRPDLAVKRESDGGVWKDRKGLAWLDASSLEVWDYVIAVAKESHAIGFDEINFDYVRFPSDGNMSDIAYPISGTKSKPEVMKSFFEYVHKNLNGVVVTSADLFGMTTTNKDDLNIGQVLEDALPYFDYIAPMVYPSHYPPNFNGYANPNDVPYEVVKYSMDGAVARAKTASTSPLKLRPWLQDFDYGGDYDVKEVRAQIQATYDAGLTSFMIWSPNNRYTRGALENN